MRLPRNVRIFRGQLDAAPFLGVFFILLMFILLHTSLVSHPGVEIQLPFSGELPGPDGPTRRRRSRPPGVPCRLPIHARGRASRGRDRLGQPRGAA